jgi:hypothetical protein
MPMELGLLIIGLLIFITSFGWLAVASLWWLFSHKFNLDRPCSFLCAIQMIVGIVLVFISAIIRL